MCWLVGVGGWCCDLMGLARAAATRRAADALAAAELRVLSPVVVCGREVDAVLVPSLADASSRGSSAAPKEVRTTSA